MDLHICGNTLPPPPLGHRNRSNLLVVMTPAVPHPDPQCTISDDDAEHLAIGLLHTVFSRAEFLPRKGTVIQVDERARVLGRRAPTTLGVVGSVVPTLRQLLGKVATKSDTKFWDHVTEQRRKWDDMLDKQADPARSMDRIHPQAVARAVSDLAKRDAVFVLDTGLNTFWSANWIRQSGLQRMVGSFNNAAVGTALGQANGIQALDRARQVIALCGDGGFNMLMSEFLTAVHHSSPSK